MEAQYTGCAKEPATIIQPHRRQGWAGEGATGRRQMKLETERKNGPTLWNVCRPTKIFSHSHQNPIFSLCLSVSFLETDMEDDGAHNLHDVSTMSESIKCGYILCTTKHTTVVRKLTKYYRFKFSLTGFVKAVQRRIKRERERFGNNFTAKYL